MRRLPDPELIGVRFDGMGRAAGQADAAPVLREHGFARVFGCAEEDTDVVAPAPVPRRRDGVGYLNEDALLAMLAALYERTAAALQAGRFPVVYGADCAVLLATVPALKGMDGHAGLLHLDAHEDATPMARTDDGEAANMEIGLLTGLDGERPAAEMPVPLPALSPDAVAMLGVRDATWRLALDVPSVEGRLFMRTAEQVSDAPRDSVHDAHASAGGDAGLVASCRSRRALVAGVPRVRRARRAPVAGRAELGDAHDHRRRGPSRLGMPRLESGDLQPRPRPGPVGSREDRRLRPQGQRRRPDSGLRPARADAHRLTFAPHDDSDLPSGRRARGGSERLAQDGGHAVDARRGEPGELGRSVR